MPIYRESSTFETEIAIMRETYDCTLFSVATVYVCLCLFHHNHSPCCEIACFSFVCHLLLTSSPSLSLFHSPLFHFTSEFQFSSVHFSSIELNSFGLPDVCLPFSIAICMVSPLFIYIRSVLVLVFICLYLCVCVCIWLIVARLCLYSIDTNLSLIH